MNNSPLHLRLMQLAMDVANAAFAIEEGKAPPVAIESLAESASMMSNELRDKYVPADDEGGIPTNAQGIALARFLRPAFREGVRDAYATVARGGFDLPDGYITVRLADGYNGGIARDGRTST